MERLEKTRLSDQKDQGFFSLYKLNQIFLFLIGHLKREWLSVKNYFRIDNQK